MSQESVRNYYAAFDESEWQRLTWPEGVIEFAVTTRAFDKYLPPHGRVLDIGGGPGRYSIWLAQRGYAVVLADLSPNLLDIARVKIAEAGVQSQVEEVVVCDACDLSRFATASFDAVLCLGPFYHLIDPADRERAATELVRVLKPQSMAFVAFMPLYTFLRRTLALKDERRHLAQPDFVARLMNEGVFLNDVPDRFNAGYGVRPQEVAPFMERRGLKTIELLADTGFAAPHVQHLAELAESNPHAYERAMDIIVSTANDPSLLGASIHLLYVGQKQAR
ncbi:Glycine/sarcosine N-methyltransferase [Thermoflexales bacterium]|nr:Glycine/sarcosine N-methyltransferase [Thermoflexales bacterium]